MGNITTQDGQKTGCKEGGKMIDHAELVNLLEEADASVRSPETTLAVLKARLWEMVERSQARETARKPRESGLSR